MLCHVMCHVMLNYWTSSFLTSSHTGFRWIILLFCLIRTLRAISVLQRSVKRFRHEATVLSKSMAKRFNNDYRCRELNNTITPLALVGREFVYYLPSNEHSWNEVCAVINNTYSTNQELNTTPVSRRLHKLRLWVGPPLKTEHRIM